MKTILHIEPNGKTNTCEFVKNISTQINKNKNFNCIIATSTDNNYGELIETHDFFKGYNNYTNFLVKLLFYTLGLLRLLHFLIKNRNIDAVQYHWPKFSPFDLLLILILKKLNVCSIQTVHNNLPHEPKVYDVFFFRLIYLRSNVLVFLSEQSKKSAELKFGLSKNTKYVIPHYGYADWINYSGSSQKETGITHFLFFGVIREYKGLDLLIAASKTLAEKYSDWKLTIAGQEDKSTYNLKKATEGLGKNILWKLGWLTDEELDDLIKSSDVVVLPYKRIDSSGALYFSMSHGKLVIGTPVGVISERIEDQTNGLLMKDISVGELVKKMEWCITNPEQVKKIGDRAKNEMKSDFSLESIAKLYVQSYQFEL